MGSHTKTDDKTATILNKIDTKAKLRRNSKNDA
jgi:hypothetical protein